jgi:hypothetical protein
MSDADGPGGPLRPEAAKEELKIGWPTGAAGEAKNLSPQGGPGALSLNLSLGRARWCRVFGQLPSPAPYSRSGGFVGQGDRLEARVRAHRPQ